MRSRGLRAKRSVIPAALMIHFRFIFRVSLMSVPRGPGSTGFRSGS
jgi:hypothetical protein